MRGYHSVNVTYIKINEDRPKYLALNIHGSSWGYGFSRVFYRVLQKTANPDLDETPLEKMVIMSI